jgi:hypothetical protein
VLPQFPNFKFLKWTDREDIEAFTNRFPPYSDFNFTSLYSWDIDNKMQVSILNDNLVILFADYISGKPFLSFIGNTNIPETANILLEYSKEHFNESSLKLFPETVALSLYDMNFAICSDRNAFDYIYPVADLMNMHLTSTNQNPGSRNIRLFLEQYPDHSCTSTPLCKTDIDDYHALYELWACNKGIDHLSTNEFKAFGRLLEVANEQILGLRLYIGGELKGFVLYELLPSEYAIAHFSKGDISYKGITEMLLWYVGQHLSERNISHFNFEQDLGIESLRQSKEKYKLHYFLKKYTIELKEQTNS